MTERDILRLYMMTDMAEEERDIMIDEMGAEQQEQYHKTVKESIPIMEQELAILKQQVAEKTARPKVKMCELDGYGLPEYETYTDEYGKTRKRKVNSDYANARDRLRAIPSELETMLFLHDEGKIILGYLSSYELWLNKDNGVDISFAERRERRVQQGMLYNAFCDVKNMREKESGRDFPNLYLEVTGINGNWHAWTDHYKTQRVTQNGMQYEIVTPNRYIAYVRGGQRYGGKLAEETEAYSDNLSEYDNRKALIQYYFEKQAELLNHDIFIVRGEDMNKYIEEIMPGKREILERKNKRITEFDLSPQIQHWEKQFSLMRVKRTVNGWNKQHTGKGSFELEARAKQPGSINADTGEYTQITLEQLSRAEKWLDRCEAHQARGLSLSTCLQAQGIDIYPSRDKTPETRQGERWTI